MIRNSAPVVKVEPDRLISLSTPAGIVYINSTQARLTAVDLIRAAITVDKALGWPAGMVGFPRRADGGARVEIDGVAYRARDLFDVGSPAQTVTEKARSWQRRAFVATNIRANSAVRGEHEPAPTLAFGHERPQWVDADAASGVRGVPVTPSEAGQLQSFRADYPWHGLPSSQFQQIGNAVPPLLAQAITGVVLTANE